MFRQTLMAIAARPWLRELAEEHPVARAVARRFIAGETVEEGLATARELNRRGFNVTLDHLGENTRHASEADDGAATYRCVLERIAATGLDANVSLKLTQFGIDFDEPGCERRLEEVVARAAGLANFVRIDMESSRYTERTLAMFARVHKRFPGHLGPVIQAYLYRSEADVRALIRLGVRVRLCKGAYAEPPHLAHPQKAEVDRSYVRLMEQLLLLGRYPALATHDDKIVDHARRFAARWQVASDAFEFQMLYGVRRDLQARLLDAGYNIRVYVPFGVAWYPYLTRRLAERPANVAFIVRSLAQEAVGG